ncbi:MAG: hypothetical protein V4733_04920 [Verrucomicrobiota bacterium]
MTNLLAAAIFCAALPCGNAIGAMLQERLESNHQALLEDRRTAMPGLSDPYGIPAAARIVVESPSEAFRSRLPWKRNVIATIFWIGEQPSLNNPVPNTMSAWDANWQANFGGLDDPRHRQGWNPAGFTPFLNPFYLALPYNDVAPGGVHRAEAPEVIPWFWESYRGDGISVCKGRWLAVHHKGRVCYGQWEDVGPFETTHWQYVFGKEDPRSNRNQNAGIDLSPAIRDYLGLRSGGMVEWRFVREQDVPRGPWLQFPGKDRAVR